MTSYGNNSITTSNNGTLQLNGNLLINSIISNTIIGIQLGTSTSTGGQQTVTFNNSFPSSKYIFVNVSANNASTNYVNLPVVTYPTNNTNFSWIPYYGVNGQSGLYSNGSYSISWIAICYE